MSVVRIIQKSYVWHVAPAQDGRLLHQRGVLVGTNELVILITIVDFLFRQEDEWSTCCASDDPACYGPRSSTPWHVWSISKNSCVSSGCQGGGSVWHITACNGRVRGSEERLGSVLFIRVAGKLKEPRM